LWCNFLEKKNLARDLPNNFISNRKNKHCTQTTSKQERHRTNKKKKVGDVAKEEKITSLAVKQTRLLPWPF
jgi:hypothetical protein